MMTELSTTARMETVQHLVYSPLEKEPVCTDSLNFFFHGALRPQKPSSTDPAPGPTATAACVTWPTSGPPRSPGLPATS